MSNPILDRAAEAIASVRAREDLAALAPVEQALIDKALEAAPELDRRTVGAAWIVLGDSIAQLAAAGTEMDLTLAANVAQLAGQRLYTGEGLTDSAIDAQMQGHYATYHPGATWPPEDVSVEVCVGCGKPGDRFIAYGDGFMCAHCALTQGLSSINDVRRHLGVAPIEGDGATFDVPIDRRLFTRCSTCTKPVVMNGVTGQNAGHMTVEGILCGACNRDYERRRAAIQAAADAEYAEHDAPQPSGAEEGPHCPRCHGDGIDPDCDGLPEFQYYACTACDGSGRAPTNGASVRSEDEHPDIAPHGDELVHALWLPQLLGARAATRCGRTDPRDIVAATESAEVTCPDCLRPTAGASEPVVHLPCLDPKGNPTGHALCDNGERNADTGTPALLREHIPAPGREPDAIRQALAELQSAGLEDLRRGSAAVAARCQVVKQLGPRAGQSLLFLQRIVHDYGERLAANLGPGAVDDLADNLIRSIAAVATAEAAQTVAEAFAADAQPFASGQ